MLDAIGIACVSELFEAVPPSARPSEPLRLPDPLDELTLTQHMGRVATRNSDAGSHVCFLGGGIYDGFAPAVVDALASRGEFATSYTPYQPELSQGMLQAIYEFQSMICALTGMEIANASMYDGATAMAEAALMLATATGRSCVVVSRTVHPHYRQVLQTYCEAADVAYSECPYGDGRTDMDALARLLDDRAACAVVQNPNFLGSIEDVAGVVELAARVGARTVVVVDPVSLALLAPPGDVGADVVVGEAQGLGAPMGFGGPLLGIFACKAEFQRRFPGRIVGLTHDLEGRRGFTMTLRTREQDIRREKATSNTCTNEALLALAATIYLCALGPAGLREAADLSLQKAHYTAERLCGVGGVRRSFASPYFREFALTLPPSRPVHDTCRALRERGFLAGYPLGATYPELHECLLVGVTERRTRQEIDAFAQAMMEVIEGAGA
jgi:glycine dehydrogenase subunit 1